MPLCITPSNLTEAQYYANVEKAKSYIQAGDIFQVVLSQRLSMKITCDPFDIYRSLRFINPTCLSPSWKCARKAAVPARQTN